MFNSADHEARVHALARGLTLAEDQSWLKTVDQRYGALLLIQMEHREEALRTFRTRINAANDPAMAERWAENEEQTITLNRGLARDLMSGVTSCRAPARSEALVRLFEEASGRKL